MPVIADFNLVRYEDGTLTISLSPPTPIGGANIRFLVQHHFGGISGLIQKSVASGYNAVSGITVTNSGQGVFNVALRSVDTSGFEYGNYAYTTERLDSGSRTVISEGFMKLLPGGAV